MSTQTAPAPAYGHAPPQDPWHRLRQLREAELQAQREWEAAHEEEQRLKRAWKAAQARVQQFIDSGQDEAPLFEGIEDEAPRRPSLVDAVRGLDPAGLSPGDGGVNVFSDRPLPVGVDGGPASTDGAEVRLPVPPVRVPASEAGAAPAAIACATCGSPIAGTVYHGKHPWGQCRPCFEHAHTPDEAPAAWLFPAAAQDRWPAGVLPSLALKAKVLTVADALRLEPEKPPRGLSPMQAGALLDAANAWVKAGQGPPKCHLCGRGGRPVDMPSQYDENTDLAPCDMVNIDLLDQLPDGKKLTTDNAAEHWLCLGCHEDLALLVPDPEPPVKPKKKGKAKAPQLTPTPNEDERYATMQAMAELSPDSPGDNAAPTPATDLGAWVREVRDPATAAAEPEQTIKAGAATVCYTLAPLPDGRWAMKYGFSIAGAGVGCGGSGTPWETMPGRQECLDAIHSAARGFFREKTKPHNGPSARKAAEAMLKKLSTEKKPGKKAKAPPVNPEAAAFIHDHLCPKGPQKPLPDPPAPTVSVGAVKGEPIGPLGLTAAQLDAALFPDPWAPGAKAAKGLPLAAAVLLGKVNSKDPYLVVERTEHAQGVAWRLLRLWTHKEWDDPKAGLGGHWAKNPTGAKPEGLADDDRERLTGLVVRSGRKKDAPEYVVGEWSQSRVLVEQREPAKAAPVYVEGTCSSCERPDCTTLDPATRRCGYCRVRDQAVQEAQDAMAAKETSGPPPAPGANPVTRATPLEALVPSGHAGVLEALAKYKVRTAGDLIDKADKALLPSHPFSGRLFAAVRGTPPLGAGDSAAFCREVEALLLPLAGKGKKKAAKE